jgi:3-oxoacyl-[acyl-carrier-protein] synthase-3
MPNAIISGIGFHVPPRVVTNDDLRTVYGIDTTHEWIVQRTGIEQRRFVEDGVRTSDLAVPASREAIERAGLQPTDIDLIILATLSPDCHFPGTAVYLQQKLGVCDGKNPRFMGAMDIRNQCSGFIYSLATASSMIKAGAVRHVLVVGSEVHSHALDLSTRGRTVSSLFGDAAGAVVVSATDEDRGIREFKLGADGRFADDLCLKVWDIGRMSYFPTNERGEGVVSPEMMWPQMNGKTVFRWAVERMMTVLFETCQAHGCTGADIDLFLFHQANLRINQYVQEQLGIPPEKTINNIQRYGNTTAATIPSLMYEAEKEGKLKKGMKVACVAFGAGFTWAAMIIDW